MFHVYIQALVKSVYFPVSVLLKLVLLGRPCICPCVDNSIIFTKEAVLSLEALSLQSMAESESVVCLILDCQDWQGNYLFSYFLVLFILFGAPTRAVLCSPCLCPLFCVGVPFSIPHYCCAPE